jgi:hypothetical protein
MRGHELDDLLDSSSGQGEVLGFIEHSNECWGSVTCRAFLDRTINFSTRPVLYGVLGLLTVLPSSTDTKYSLSQQKCSLILCLY